MSRASNKISLVACMMVYNEAPFIPEVMRQLHAVCDSIIVQDNGSSDKSVSTIMKNLKTGDIFKDTKQTNPPNYADLRNNMLKLVEDGTWVLKWDADETPTGAMVHLKDYLGKHAGNNGVFGVPIYHMRTPTQALNWEYGFCHSRLFLKQSDTRFEGAVHEQITKYGRAAILEQVLGFGVIHWSYFCDDRLRRKELEYAKVPGSGHGVGTLTRAWDSGLRDLPPNMDYTVSNGFLESIKNA